MLIVQFLRLMMSISYRTFDNSALNMAIHAASRAAWFCILLHKLCILPDAHSTCPASRGRCMPSNAMRRQVSPFGKATSHAAWLSACAANAYFASSNHARAFEPQIAKAEPERMCRRPLKPHWPLFYETGAQRGIKPSRPVPGLRYAKAPLRNPQRSSLVIQFTTGADAQRALMSSDSMGTAFRSSPASSPRINR